MPLETKINQEGFLRTLKIDGKPEKNLPGLVNKQKTAIFIFPVISSFLL